MRRYITVLLPEYQMELRLYIKANLTITELLLFELLLQGKDIAEIATYRQRSTKTISSQKLKLYKKLGIKSDITFWRDVILRYKPMINHISNYKRYTINNF